MVLALARLRTNSQWFPDAFVIGLGEQFEHRPVIVGMAEDLLHRIDDGLDGFEARDGALGRFGVVPEVRRGHFLIDGGEFLELGGEVKESPESQ
jgi:hypothetical protein